MINGTKGVETPFHLKKKLTWHMHDQNSENPVRLSNQAKKRELILKSEHQSMKMETYIIRGRRKHA
jgi:hypothetical protein